MCAQEFGNAQALVLHLKEVTDSYLNKSVDKLQYRSHIEGILASPKHRGFMFRADAFAPIMVRLAKKRLEPLKAVLAEIDGVKYGNIE